MYRAERKMYFDLWILIYRIPKQQIHYQLLMFYQQSHRVSFSMCFNFGRLYSHAYIRVTLIVGQKFIIEYDSTLSDFMNNATTQPIAPAQIINPYSFNYFCLRFVCSAFFRVLPLSSCCRSHFFLRRFLRFLFCQNSSSRTELNEL